MISRARLRIIPTWTRPAPKRWYLPGTPASTWSSRSRPISAGCNVYRPWSPWYYAQMPGERWRLWILDVGGVRVVIQAMDFEGTSPDVKAQLQGIVDSIAIEPATTPAASPSPGSLAWSPASQAQDWPAPVRAEPAGDPVLVPLRSGLADYMDPAGRHRILGVPWADIAKLSSVSSNHMYVELAEQIPTPVADPVERWMAYGLVLDVDADGVPDVRLGSTTFRAARAATEHGARSFRPVERSRRPEARTEESAIPMAIGTSTRSIRRGLPRWTREGEIRLRRGADVPLLCVGVGHRGRPCRGHRLRPGFRVAGSEPDLLTAGRGAQRRGRPATPPPAPVDRPDGSIQGHERRRRPRSWLTWDRHRPSLPCTVVAVRPDTTKEPTMPRARPVLALLLAASFAASFGVRVLAADPAASGPAAPASSPGFATPDDATRAYLAALASADVNGILSTTAIDQMSAGFRFDLQADRMQALQPMVMLGPSDHALLSEMDTAQLTSASTSLRRVPSSTGFTDIPTDGTMVVPFGKDEADRFAAQAEPSRLAGIVVTDVRFPNPAFEHDPANLRTARRSRRVYSGPTRSPSAWDLHVRWRALAGRALDLSATAMSGRS